MILDKIKYPDIDDKTRKFRSAKITRYTVFGIRDIYHELSKLPDWKDKF